MVTTPLVRLNVPETPAEIYLKLENLQPVGSFKARPAGNVMLNLAPAERERGVFTASTGNLGIATAWLANHLRVAATVLVPDDAPRKKIEGLRRLGAVIRELPYDAWWEVILTHRCPDIDATYVDGDGAIAMAGSGTIGLEILEQLPDVDTVIASYGGGGFACGVASAIKALNPDVRVMACELETAMPLTVALKADRPVEVPYERSFVTGMCSTCVLPWMWPLVRDLLDGTVVVSLQQVTAAIRWLVEHNRVVAEGAGAAPVAAALAGQAGAGKVVCIVSGGNLGIEELATILMGGMPGPEGSG